MSFDAEVKVGEIRVFADAKEPLVAAVVGSRGLAGWRIVPVSPYRVPVSEDELKIGERVFQLWNACTAAKSFVARSWIVDTLAPSDLARLTERDASLRTAAFNGRLGDYERRTLAVGGDFAGWQAKFPVKRKWVWPTASWAAAAVVLVSVGAFYLLQNADDARVAEGRAMTVRMEKVPPPVEVAACAAEDEESREMSLAPVEIDLQVVKDELPKCAPAPQVKECAAAPRRSPVPMAARLAEMRRDAVVVKKAVPASKATVSFGPKIAATLAELKGKQKPDGSWGKKPVKDTALAVLAMMANGETADSKEYGPAMTAGVKYLAEANLEGQSRQDVQIAACALCCATVTMRNPNIRTAAEKALASIGDRRSVEAGRDWSGLLVDLTKPARKAKSSRAVAAEPSEKDDIAETSLHVLQMLSVSDNWR